MSKVQELNSLVASVVSEVLKQNKRAKAMAVNDYGLEKEPWKFNFKNLIIMEE